MPVPFFNTGGPLSVPFLDGNFMMYFCVVSLVFAVALGLAQTMLESRRGTWLFLLHRPMSRRRILAVKLAVGGGMYLVCGSIGIIAFGIWAEIPGNHASPFQWWMTVDAWKAWAVIAILYPAAFFTGTRPARWFGTRLLPLFAAGLAAAVLTGRPAPPAARNSRPRRRRASRYSRDEPFEIARASQSRSPLQFQRRHVKCRFPWIFQGNRRLPKANSVGRKSL
jgi:hypothetical protein